MKLLRRTFGCLRRLPVGMHLLNSCRGSSGVSSSASFNGNGGSFAPPKRRNFVALCLWFLLGFAGLTTVYIAVIEIMIHGETVMSGDTNAGANSENTLHYAVVIDAGSSGSRAYLYSWPPHSGQRSQLLSVHPVRNKTGVLFPDASSSSVSLGSPLHKTISPGLSSMGSNPEAAAEYFFPLLDFAQEHIPANKISETPLYILATAGMRLLKTSEQNDILHNVRRGIPKRYNFFFPPANIEIISGRQEGMYQWIAMNYGLGFLANPDIKEDEKKKKNLVLVENPLDPDRHLHRVPTGGILDMGGASLQIAFEVTSSEEERMIKKNGPQESEIIHVNLGPFDDDAAHVFRVFVTTYLGFGANEKMAHHREILLTAALNVSQGQIGNAEGLTKEHPIHDPCLPAGLEQSFLLKPKDFLPKKTAQFYFGVRNDAAAAPPAVSPSIQSASPSPSNSSSSRVVASRGRGLAATVPDEAEIFFAGNGDFESCLKYLTPLTDKWRREDKACVDALNSARRKSEASSSVELRPSELPKGVAPSLPCNPRPVMVPPGVPLSHRAFYAFSEFWYSSEDVLRLGHKVYDRKTLGNAVKNWCETSWEVLFDRYEKHLYPNSDEKRMKEECFKGVWILVALHQGLGFPENFGNIKAMPNVMGDKVFTWTLGALLHRMRRFPLKAIELRETQMSKLLHPRYLHSYWDSFRLHNSFLFICVVLVIAVILFQIRRLIKHFGSSPSSSLPVVHHHHHHLLHHRPSDDDPWTPMLRHSATAVGGFEDPEAGSGVDSFDQQRQQLLSYGRRNKLPHSASFAYFDRVPSPSSMGGS